MQDIHGEITAGLPNERDRLDDARVNADFFRGRLEAYTSRPISAIWEGPRYERTSRIMGWLIETLAQHLYAEGPTRTLPGQAEASAWLADCYRASAIDALMQGADQWSTVGEVAAIQVVPTEDPLRPVRHVLWPAHQFCVWESEDDPLRPEAVAVIDAFDHRRRLRLYTADRQAVYVTDKLGPGQTAGGTAYRLAETLENPSGVLPFAFAHYNFPTVDFWSGSPGENFRQLNDYINYSLTEVGDNLRYCGKPVLLAQGVRPGWKPNLPIRPGDLWDLPSEDLDAGGNGNTPEIKPLQFDLGFVEAFWADIQSFLDHSMQCAGVPPAAFRMIQDSAKSGASIVAEQLPLIQRAKGRQRPFGHYEAEMARVTLAVAGTHLRDNGMAGADALLEAARAPGLSLRWPEIGGRVVDPLRDQEDGWRLDRGLASKTQIIQERFNMTREEAEAYLLRVAEDRRREDALFGEEGPDDGTQVQA